MNLTKRQQDIINVIKNNEPVTSDVIAKKLNLGKSTLRNDLMVLGMLEIILAKQNVGYYFNHTFSINALNNNQKNKKVKDAMAVAVVAKIDETYSEVLAKLFLHDVGTIFVVDNDDCLVGVISRKDMLKCSQNKNVNKLPAAIIMTRKPNIKTIFEDDLVVDALHKIITHQIDCLPVVRVEDNKQKVVGKISKTTFINLLLDVLEGER